MAKTKSDPSAQEPVLAIEATSTQLRVSIEKHLRFTLARDTLTAKKRDWWMATCLALRDHIMERYMQTQSAHHQENTRRVYYLSMEYLMGRLLLNNLHASGLFDTAKKALKQLKLDLDEIVEEEVDMGLGNGGLGRLAVCFLDSLATMELPAVGYGIHYEFGLFEQKFIDGQQREYPDAWLEYGNPWQILRPEYAHEIKLYGHTENYTDMSGVARVRWVSDQRIKGVPWDIPIVGYGAHTVNFLRLWESRASKSFDLNIFNSGGYVEAVREKAISETVSKVLYPNDQNEAGKELRLVQQYFFVACSLHDIIRRFRAENSDWEDFPEKVVIQLNDTHPAVAVLELMRIFIDEESLSWDHAWSLCRKCFAYTNHTLLPEALEKWSVPLFGKVLPRHLQLVMEINAWFLDEEVAQKWPGDNVMRAKLSLIEEGQPQMIRMAYLAVVASFSVNGVAALHSKLLQRNLFSTFKELYPDRFNNKTNGVTPRRFVKVANPKLAQLLDDTIGREWITDLDQLRKLEAYADNKRFQKDFMAVKRHNKERLCKIIQQHCELSVDPDALFDVQIKRLHEYKRQHLNLLHILTLYQQLIENPDLDVPKRVFVFGAKAAPGYTLAKAIIHSINACARQINHDARIKDKIKIAFLPNYNVSLAEKIIPAADLSEQISTAGKEASGTGNMKLALNGAVTIGTLDGANVEIMDRVGEDNIFIFGLKVDEVEQMRSAGYDPRVVYEQSPQVQSVLRAMESDYFTQAERNSMQMMCHSLLDGGDPYFVLADYAAYCYAQRLASQAYAQPDRWAKMSILNTARIGFFSSDRSIHDYATDIWKLKPLPVSLVCDITF